MQNRDYFSIASAGIFVGAALFDAFPESAASLGIGAAVVWLAAGMFAWWGQKRVLNLLEKPEMPALVTTALWFHSALEGIVTGMSFGVSQTFGLVVLVAMILHLLPEFFAAVSLMRGAGANGRSAALTAFAGYAVLFAAFAVTYLYLPMLGNVLPAAIGLSGGAFLYIGAKIYLRKFGLVSTAIFLAGMFVPFLQKTIFG